jgi:hypothetical protein
MSTLAPQWREYNWQCHTAFRFSLPSHLVSLPWPVAGGADCCTPGTPGGKSFTPQGAAPVLASAPVAAASASAPASASQSASDAKIYSPPDTLEVSLYERTFFTDTCIGSLVLSLHLLRDTAGRAPAARGEGGGGGGGAESRAAFRSWVPLTTTSGISWLADVECVLHWQLA